MFVGQASLSMAAPIQMQVDQAVAHGPDALGVGSAITLKIPTETNAHSGIFLGRMLNWDQSTSQYMVVDAEKNRVYMVDEKDLEMPKMTTQPVLRQYDQVGGTCTGYAIDDLMQEMNLNGFEGNGTLKTTLSTEKGRTQLLVDSINQYYLVTQHKNSIEGILSMYGKQYGFKCPKKMFQDTESAIAWIEKTVNTTPILVSFNIGPTMVTSAYTMEDYSKPSPLLDNRLWVPRKTGERNSGGHSIVAIAAFEVNHRKKLLMLDSDWPMPRIWDAEQYLGAPKTAISEIEFYGCK